MSHQDTLTKLLADLLDYGPPPGDWVLSGLCAQTDPDAFFPEKGGSTVHAQRICARCEVRVECREYAVRTGQKFGVWGGLSTRQLRDECKGAAA